MDKILGDIGFDNLCEAIAKKQETKENLNITQIRSCMSVAFEIMAANSDEAIILLSNAIEKRAQKSLTISPKI